MALATGRTAAGISCDAVTGPGPLGRLVRRSSRSQKIWQVNFKFNVSPAEYAAAVAPLADPIARVKGLHWKVWVVNPDEREAGGIHLFADQAALDAYAASNIVAGLLNHPALSEFSVKTFDVMEAYSAKTRAPVGTAMVT